MRTTIIVTASALLLAALVTEAHFRLFAGNYFALLLITFLAPGGQRPVQRPPRQPERRLPARQVQAATGQTGARARARTRLIDGGKREEGTVKWFDEAKGFGFIIRADRSEIFVHKRAVRSDRGRTSAAL